MTTPTMTLTEAANRLRILAKYGNQENATVVITEADLEAVTFAAAFLGVFVESLENVG